MALALNHELPKGHKFTRDQVNFIDAVCRAAPGVEMKQSAERVGVSRHSAYRYLRNYDVQTEIARRLQADSLLDLPAIIKTIARMACSKRALTRARGPLSGNGQNSILRNSLTTLPGATGCFPAPCAW